MMRPVLARVAPALFVLSGLAGLILQVAWFRLLAQSLGGSLAATTVVLSAFMLGLALGAWAIGRRARFLRNGVLAYGLLEAGAGVAALLTLPLLQGLDRIYGSVAGAFPGAPPGLLLGLKFLLAGAVLVPATACMGGTLPALCQALAARPETAGARTGLLYALNTWGAVLGVLAGLFWTLPRLGLSGSVTLAAMIDLVVAAVVLLVGRARPGRVAAPPAAAGAPSAQPAHLGLFSALLFCVGLAGLGYEVLWSRVLAFYFGSGAYGFGLTLAAVLIGLALGGLIGGRLADASGRPVWVFAGSQLLLCLAVAVQIWRFPMLPDRLFDIASGFELGIDFKRLIFLLLIGALGMLLPASLLMGVALPAAVRTVIRHEGETGTVVGRLVAANTLGTIPGAMLAAYVLIPAIGTQGALIALAVLNGVVAVVALAIAGSPGDRRLAVGAAGFLLGVVAVVLVAAEPQRVFLGNQQVAGGGLEDGEEEFLALEESAHGTVSLTRIRDSRGTWLSLSIDGVNVAGTSPPLVSCQVLQGQLPVLLHPDPKRVLHVGFGSGGTAAAVLSHPSIEQLDIAEINPVVPRISTRDFAIVNSGVLEDPRARVIWVDGRNHVMSTRERYDLILSDSIHPRYSGNANLYTADYFASCREKLAPGGLVSTWLPIYSLSEDSLRSIVASMRSVFPETSLWYLNSTVNEFVVLIGRTEGPGIDVARMERALEIPSVRDSLATVGLHSSHAVLDFFVAQGRELDDFVRDVPLHHDDLPWVEFESATILDRTGSWRVNFDHVIAARHSVLPYLRGADPGYAEVQARWEAATTEQLQGQRALLGSDVPGLRAAFERAIEINPDDREPWEFFGAPAWVEGVLADAEERVPR
jgi:spermidine synthase